MKKLLGSLAVAFLAMNLAAVEYPAPGKSVPAGFVDDLSLALQDAKETDRFVFVCFSGSDWCGWCVKLEQEVFSAGETEGEFAAKLKDDYVLVFIDLPSDRSRLSEHAKVNNEALCQQYKVRGFPTALIIDPKTDKIIDKTGYRRGGLEPYVEYLKNLHKNADEIMARNAAFDKYVKPMDLRIEAVFSALNKRCGEYIDSELAKEGNTKTFEELKAECIKFVPEFIPEFEKILADFKASEVPQCVKKDLDRKIETFSGYVDYMKKQSAAADAK